MVSDKKIPNNVETVAQLCVDFWKLIAATEKALAGVLSKDGKRLEAQLKFSKRQLDVILQELGLRLVDFYGERFHPGLAVSVDNPAEYSEDEALVVSKTLEPTIMYDMTVVRLGRIIVAPARNEEE